MPGTSLRAGDLAVIGYNSGEHDATGHPDTLDKLYFVLLKPIVSGTQIFISDRSWNGSSFVNAANDGTVAYTAGADLAAGTVVEMSISGGTASFTINGVAAGSTSAGTFNIEDAGDAVYLYQGSNADTPTSFLYASEFADGNTTFNGSLVNTGLSVAAGTAAAISFDSGAYAGPTTYAGSFLQNGASTTLLQSIADPTNWTGANQTGQNAVEQHVQTGPWLTAADMDMWGTSVLGGGGIVHVSEDHTFSSGTTAFNTSDLYNNLIVGGTSFFWHLADMVFDTVAGKFFVVDSDLGGGHNRIMEGNISDLLSNPGTTPTMTTLYSDPSTATDASNRLDNLEVDRTNHIVYFTHAGDLDKVNYDTANQTPVVLFRSDITGASSPSGVGNPAGSTSNFFNDMVIDFGTGHIYLSSTRVGASASGDIISKNYIYDLSGLTIASGTDAFVFNATNTGTARLLPFLENDANYDPIPGTSAATHSTPASAQPYFFPKERGSLDGLALDPVNHILYFSTGEILFDHDGSSGTAPVYVGGVVASYALTSNATGAITVLFQQPAQSSGAVPGLMGDLEIDTATGRYYVTDTTGASGTDGTDQYIWTGLLGSASTPTIFANNINSIDSLTTTGMTINHAPTITGTGLTPGVTEASNGPGSGETSKVGLFSTVTVDDIDTSTLNEITGAVVRISAGFQSGATHQDFLEIGGNTSGSIAGTSISFTYSSATGAMVLTGAGSVAQYKAAIESVTFSTSGDDPTAYGTDGARTIAASVSDGLSMSDEISATVSVTGINDAPVNTAGSAATVIEDSSANSISGVSVFDVDADPASQNITVTLSVADGTITLLTNVTNGITGSNITGGATAAVGATSITITGTQNAINATLAAAGGLTYTPTGNYNGADALHIVTNDNNFNGTGGAQSDNAPDKIINITPVNDAPVVTGGTTQATTTIDEDTPLAAGQSISSLLTSHFDDSTDQQQTSPGNLTGSVANTLAGIAVTANGSSAGTGQWQFSTNGGTTWTDIGAASVTNAHLFNAATLLRFNPTLNYNGAEPTLTVHLIDSSGAAITDNATTNLTGLFGGTNRYSSGTVDLGGTINAIDDAPVNTPGATATLSEDATNVALTGISVSDVDVGAGNLTVTLSVAHGTITLATNVGGGIDGTMVTGGAGAAVGATSITVTATQAQINATLAAASGLTYTPTADYNGSDALHIVTNDNGNTGNGGPLTDTDDKTITITAVNDPVTGTVPGPITTAEDSTNVPVSGMSISDVDTVLAPNGIYQVTLSSTHGTMTLTTLTGLTFSPGSDGTADATMTFHGTLANINAALATATYTPDANYNGTDASGITLQVTDTFNSIVATGTGSATSDSDSISVTVTAVNDAPVNHVPGAQSFAEDGTLTFTGGNAISVSDIDAGAGNLTVTLSVNHGTLTLGGTLGLDFSAGSGGVGDGTADTTMTFSGTASAITTALNNMFYTPDANFNGADTLTITTNDNGNTGTPGAQQDQDTVAITVTAVNDAPVVAIGEGTQSLATIQEDQPQDNLSAASVGTVFANAFDDSADQQAGGSSANSLAGIAVVSSGSSAAGEWQYWNGAAWQNIGAASASSAHLLNAATLIRFDPVADYNGAPSLTVRLVDSSGAAFTDNSVVDLSGLGATGGATRYSSGTVALNETVSAVADIADDSATIPQNNGITTLNLLSNDTFENAGRTITSVTQGLHGSVAIDQNGNGAGPDDFVTYTPDTSYVGSDSFTYTVTSGGVTETATVNINVTSPDAAPVVDLNTASAPPDIDDTNTYTEGDAGAAIGTAIGVSDPDLGDMIHGATIALSGSVAGDQLFVNGVLPTGISIDGSSTDTFLVLTGDATPADYATALSEVQFRSTSDDPTLGGTHNDRTIGVTVNDGILNSTAATMTMTVVAVDDLPVAQPDAVTTDEATAINGSVFVNNGSGADTDPDGPPLSVSAVNGSTFDVGSQITLASGALLTLNANGTFNYDPNHAFDATPAPGSGASNTPAHDSFTYALAGGGSATVSITIDGLDNNDTLIGTPGADNLNGGAGDDILNGLGGADTLTGGLGNDVYAVDTGDTIVEGASEGVDQVYSSTDYVLGAGISVEVLAVSDYDATTAINLTGNELGQQLIGNAGANILSGGDGIDGLYGLGGDDVLNGGGAADYMVGGTGNDIYVVDSGDLIVEAAGEGVDQVYASTDYVLAPGVSVEVLAVSDYSATTAINLTGNELGQQLIGNAGANILSGNDGIDALYGLGGDDVLNGGGSADYMVGGTGNDIYVVDSGDVIVEAAGEGFDTAYASASYTLAAGVSIELLSVSDFAATTAINLTGNELGQQLIGNAGANILDGGDGADTLFGGGGADTFAFTTTLGAGNVDAIGDFQTGVDKIALDHAIFDGLATGSVPSGVFHVGTAATDEDQRIIYDQTTGNLYYDQDGSGGGAAILFATLSGHPTLTASDFSVI